MAIRFEYYTQRLIAALCCCVGLLLSMGTAVAETTRIAVATNFKPTIEKLIGDFEVSSQHRVQLVAGSTGKLYSQIVRGAPFDIFLSADEKHIELLNAIELVDEEHQFTYAIGRLVLWSPKHGVGLYSTDGVSSEYRLAIANPKLAPYGKAAMEVISKFKSKPPIVMGENVGQAYGMIATGNAEYGLVAKSYFSHHSNNKILLISDDLHSPIKQAVGLLKRAESNPAALSFLRYLQSPKAKEIIAASGYDLPETID